MKYKCSTCDNQIIGWPLTRPHMPFNRWCSADCLIQYQKLIDKYLEENQPLHDEYNRKK